jgi:tryptophan-rich sensory protein
MNQSNNSGILEQFVNMVMGVKTGNQQQSLNTSATATQELDIKAVLVYK